jgi:hypothetical protein
MTFVLATLFLLVGASLSVVVFREASLVERLAYGLLFAMAAIPFLAINIALLAGVFISKGLVVTLALGTLAITGPLVWRRLRRRLDSGDPIQALLPQLQQAWIPLAPAALVAVVAGLWYTRAGFLFSMASFLQNGEADCFHRQAMRFVRDLNPGLERLPVDVIYSIPSSPGNAVFTGAAMQIFGPATYHALYVAFLVLLFLFVYLLVQRLVENRAVAVAVGLFAALNPYVLWVEQLDRNVMAFALSAVLIHALIAHPGRPVLHGLLFGITAGVGLRFLPITFLLPIAVIYLQRRAPHKEWGLLLLTATLTFAFNLPHLEYHGFHALDTNDTFLELMAIAAMGSRSPYLPHPNVVFYLLNTLSYMGCLAAGLALVGLVRLYRRDRWLVGALVLLVLPTYTVLLAQRDWLEVDKPRIFITVLLPFMICLGVGLAALLDSASRRWAIPGLVLACGLLWTGERGLRVLQGTVDEPLYDKRMLYQPETRAYGDHLRRHFAPFGLFPNYRRLYQKLDLSRKQLEEQLVTHTLLEASTFEKVTQNPWILDNIHPTPPPELALSEEMVNIGIDLEHLVDPSVSAVALLPDHKDPFFVDFGSDALPTAVHADVAVSWQREPLQVSVLPQAREVGVLGEIYVELNEFRPVGDDAIMAISDINGRVEPPEPYSTELLSPVALPAGSAAFPARIVDGDTVIVLRVPANTKVIVRNWILRAGIGIPFRADTWRVHMPTTAGGWPWLEFYYSEPEGYL